MSREEKTYYLGSCFFLLPLFFFIFEYLGQIVYFQKKGEKKKKKGGKNLKARKVIGSLAWTR